MGLTLNFWLLTRCKAHREMITYYTLLWLLRSTLDWKNTVYHFGRYSPLNSHHLNDDSNNLKWYHPILINSLLVYSSGMYVFNTAYWFIRPGLTQTLWLVLAISVILRVHFHPISGHGAKVFCGWRGSPLGTKLLPCKIAPKINGRTTVGHWEVHDISTYLLTICLDILDIPRSSCVTNFRK